MIISKIELRRDIFLWSRVQRCNLWRIVKAEPYAKVIDK
jgi:hypothetical protein